MISAIKPWILASRPKTWVASLCPVFLGQALAMSEGFFNMEIFLLTVATSLLLQIIANFSNDLLDFQRGTDTSARRGPKRVCASGLVTIKAMKRVLFATTAASFIFACFLILKGGIVIAAIFILSLFLAFLYTAGPFPLTHKGLGELVAFIICGPVAVCGAYYLQTLAFSCNVLLASVSIGSGAAALMLMNNLRDREEDAQSGKRTLCVRFGRRFGQVLGTIVLLSMFIPPACFWKIHPFTLVSFAAFFPVLAIIADIFGDEKDYPLLLPKVGRAMLLYTILFGIGWML